MVQSLWPISYSESSSFVRAIFLAEGSNLEVVGNLPSGVSRETLQPFLSESFRAPDSSDDTQQHAWLNLTDGHGQSLYVEAMELKSGEGTIAICSSFPGFKLLHEILLNIVEQVQDKKNNHEYLSKLIHCVVYGIPPPMPGLNLSVSFNPPHSTSSSPWSSFSWNVADINPLDNDDISLDCISAASLVAAWDALIFEKPLVIVSSNALLLTPFVTFLNALLAPLRNAHPTVPILPPTMIDILEAPFPFLVGVRSDTFYQLSPTLEMSPSITVLDLDTGVLSHPNSHISSFFEDAAGGGGGGGGTSTDTPSSAPMASPSFVGSHSSDNDVGLSRDVDLSTARLPFTFLESLSRKVGSAINAQRIARMKCHGMFQCQHELGSATKIVKDLFICATGSLLGPRHVPITCRYDMLSMEEEAERMSDPTVMAAQISEKTALSKLAKGIISEVEYREIVSHNAAIVAASKVQGILPSKRFHFSDEVACGGLFVREADRLDDTVTKRFLWCEQDTLCFTAWALQTVSPCIFIKLEEISGISVSPALPDGCCFSISTQRRDNSKSGNYLFEACDEYSAEQWIKSLEKAARLRGGAQPLGDDHHRGGGTPLKTANDSQTIHETTPTGKQSLSEQQYSPPHFFNNEDGLSVIGAEFNMCRRALLETQHVSVFKSENAELMQVDGSENGVVDDLAMSVVSLAVANDSFELSSVTIDSNKIIEKVAEIAKGVSKSGNILWPVGSNRGRESVESAESEADSVNIMDESSSIFSCGSNARQLETQILNMSSGISDSDSESAISSPELRSTLFGRLSTSPISRIVSPVSSTDSWNDPTDSDTHVRLCKLQHLSAHFFNAASSERLNQFRHPNTSASSGKLSMSSFQMPLYELVELAQLSSSSPPPPPPSTTTSSHITWHAILERAAQYDQTATRGHLLSKVKEMKAQETVPPSECTFNQEFRLKALASLESLLLDESNQPIESLKATASGLLLDVRRNRRLILNVIRHFVINENCFEETNVGGGDVAPSDARKPLFDDERFFGGGGGGGVLDPTAGFTQHLVNLLERTKQLDPSLVLYSQARLCVVAATRFKVDEFMSNMKNKKQSKKANDRSVRMSFSQTQTKTITPPIDNLHSMIDPEHGREVLNYGPLESPGSTKGSDAIKIVSNLLALLIALVRFQQPVDPVSNKHNSFDRHPSSHHIDKSGDNLSPSRKSQSANVEHISGNKVTKSTPFQINKDILRGVSTTSGFMLFVRQSWQLQERSIGRWLTHPDRSDNERLCFLLNLYNLMTLHGIVVKGPPSTTVSVFLGRCLFQASIKYRIGDMTFDLVQIEHALLRASLSQASLTFIGAIGSPCRPFSKNDPRDCLRLRKPPPELSFGLCTFAESSPVLYVFRDPQLVLKQLEICTNLYIRKHIRIDMRARSVHMSEYLQWFAKDFGSSRREALQFWLSSMNKKICLPSDLRIKVVSYNWTLGCEFIQTIEPPKSSSSMSRAASMTEQPTSRSDEYWSKGSDKFTGW